VKNAPLVISTTINLAKTVQSETRVARCKELKKTSHVGNIGEPRVVTEPHLGAAAIERLIEERVASGVQKALEAQKTSDGSAIAGLAQADYSGNAFSLGLGGIVADSISSLERDEPRIPDDGKALIDQFGNNADAYLKRSTNYSEALVHQITTMSCIVMFLTGIYGFASSLPNRLWQACSITSNWMARAAGGWHATTAGVCILLACCVLFTQLASTQTLTPHTLTAIGKACYQKLEHSTACYRKLEHRVFTSQRHSIWA